MNCDLRLGDWRTALADVTRCAVVMTDPPYSARTHDGQSRLRDGIEYESMTPSKVHDLVYWSVGVASDWVLFMTDDVLVPEYRKQIAHYGWQDFAPVSIIQDIPRLQGDGPASCTVHLVVGRPRRVTKCGSLPGYYLTGSAGINAQQEPDYLIGGKPMALMRRLVEDYTKPGDLVVDPFAGMGTTLRACRELGRPSIGAEIDPETYARASKVLAMPWQPTLLGGLR